MKKLLKLLFITLILVCILAAAAYLYLRSLPAPNPGPGDGSTCEHVYTETATAFYLNTAATCEAPATYFKSCKLCGEKSTETFNHGKTAPHTLEEIIDDSHIKFYADCSYGAEYYMTCSVCGQHDENETFTYGDPLSHNFQKIQDRAYMLNGASCTQAARFYVSCTLCGARGSEIFTVGQADGHHFEDVAESAPTATEHGKIAHKVCTVCTLTFDMEENLMPNVPIIHSFTDFFDEAENEHFHYCQVPGCEEKSCVGEHTYSGDCDAYCNECNLVRKVETLHIDENNDGLCDVCGEPVLLPEPPKEDDTSDFDPF